MRQGDAVWTALLAAGVTYEIAVIRADRQDDTLTRWIRRRSRTSHPVGKVFFAAGWTGLSVWLIQHVVRGGLQ